MALYKYYCEVCDKSFTVRVKMGGAREAGEVCPSCSQASGERVFTSPRVLMPLHLSEEWRPRKTGKELVDAMKAADRRYEESWTPTYEDDDE